MPRINPGHNFGGIGKTGRAAVRFSPSIWNDRLVITTSNQDGTKRRCHCFRIADGSSIWKYEIDFDSHPKHAKNSFATSTPACAEEGPYLLFGSTTHYSVIALDWSGTVRWTRDLGKYLSQHGAGSSPIIVGDNLIVTYEQDGPSSVVALDRKTGREVWKTERDTNLAAYATPIVVTDTEGSQIIVSSKAGLASLDPVTGQTLWSEPCFAARCVGSPTAAGTNILASCGEGGRGLKLVCLNTHRTLSAGESRILWELTKTIPYCPTSVVVQNLVFMLLDNGVARCIKADTGEEVWTERLLSKVTSSPIQVGGRIVAVSETGQVAIFAAEEKFHLLGQGQLDDEFLATPAMAGDRMLLRGRHFLWCIGPEGNVRTAAR
jgi:outer membrane protein assembly factor BamB